MLKHHTEADLYNIDTLSQGTLLTPFQHKLLAKKLHDEVRPEYRQRIEIMLLADQGYSQTQICEMLSCCHQTARYWIAIAQAGKAHQWNERQIGRPKTVNELYLNRLKELASHSPREFGYPFQRWTAQWLKKHLLKETGIEVTEQHINRLLRNMGLSARSYRKSAISPSEVASAEPHSIEPCMEQSGIVIGDLIKTTSFSFP
jgi:transposase